MTIIFWVLLVVYVGLAAGALTAHIAELKGHKPGSWFAAGFFFPLIGLLAAVGLPDRNPDGKIQM